MGRRKEYKVGERIFFEYYDGTVGTKTVLEIKPESYVDDNGKTVNYDMLITRERGNASSGIEDYNTLPYSDPRVKALMEKLKNQDEIADLVRDFVIANSDIYDTETIAEALAQVAIEYGWQYDDL